MIARGRRDAAHAVTVFEAQSQAGGMLRFGIPEYLLPRPVLDAELQSIWDAGVAFKPNQTLGPDFTLESLRQNGYEAVFLGVGAQLSRRIPLEGCNLADVLWGVDFLRQVARGQKVRLKDNVVVIGCGNVAVDVALTALRCGARKVSLACLESEEELPASARGIEGAAAEGVNILTSWGPERIVSENGWITSLGLVECTCVVDESGNFCPQFSDRKESILAVIDANSKAAWFEFEEEKMYSKRESELLQGYLHQHGRMPSGGDALDDLF